MPSSVKKALNFMALLYDDDGGDFSLYFRGFVFSLREARFGNRKGLAPDEAKSRRGLSSLTILFDGSLNDGLQC
jgi:hypothetical protein